MIFQIDIEMSDAYKTAGLARRNIAELLNMPCGTVASKLNGYALPFNQAQRKTILEYCKQVTAKRTGKIEA